MKQRNKCPVCGKGIGNDEDLMEKLAMQMDMESPVFQSEEEFIAANPGRKRHG